jgi:release factor glutamine methyltransferase
VSSVAGTVTWRTVIAEAVSSLGGGDPESTRLDVRRLAAEAAGLTLAELVVSLDAEVTQRSLSAFDAMLERRRRGEPLQYVLGAWGFRRLDLMVDRRVLIPRPETEGVVEEALRVAADLARPLVAVDLGTGSGAIALSLALELTGEVEVWAVDASPDAVAVARYNVTGLGTCVAPRVRVVEGSWWSALPAGLRGRVGLAVSNPPYVASVDDLPAAVREWEPVTALYAGPEGLDAYREIIADAPLWLAPGGWLVFEIGATQAGDVRLLCSAAGLVNISVVPDLAGLDRTLLAQMP